MEFRTSAGPIRVNIADPQALAVAVKKRLAAGQGFALATLNLDHLAKLRTDPAFADAYAAQDFVTADGNPVVWLERLSGEDVALVTGADSIIPLAEVAAGAGRPIALLGSTDEVLERASFVLRSDAKGLDITFAKAPPMGFDPEGLAAAEMIAEVERSGAGLCFLALGAPKQERLAARGARLAPGVGFVSIGAGLDFLAGAQHRAPKFLRAMALEWLWRVANDPKRLLGRYARSLMILPGLALSAIAQRINRVPVASDAGPEAGP